MLIFLLYFMCILSGILFAGTVVYLIAFIAQLIMIAFGSNIKMEKISVKEVLLVLAIFVFLVLAICSILHVKNQTSVTEVSENEIVLANNYKGRYLLSIKTEDGVEDIIVEKDEVKNIYQCSDEEKPKLKNYKTVYELSESKSLGKIVLGFLDENEYDIYLTDTNLE